MNSFARALRRFAAGVAFLLIFPALGQAEPSYRSSPRLVFNAEPGQPLLFGGLSPQFTLGDIPSARRQIDETWVWTGRRWVQRFFANQPEPRAAHARVWDSNRDRVLVCGGGGDNNAVLGDTWQFADGTWSRIDTPSAPPARRLAAHAFDPIRDRFIIFGGSDGVTNFRDTWEFDGTSWLQTGSDGPSLVNPMLVFDAARDEVLLVGSVGGADAAAMYRYTRPGWEQIEPEKVPACVNLGSMVYQDHNQKVVLVGGACANGAPSSKTWEWDGTNWTDVETKGSPGAVYGHALVYDAARGYTILFGGIDALGGALLERNSTFIYRDGVWRFSPQGFTPGPREGFVFVSDPEEEAIWLFGGQNAGGDLWKYQHGRWTRVSAEGAPASCAYPHGTWDSARKRLVIFCGDTSDIYEFDGTKWTAFTTLTEEPPARRLSSLVYDPTLKVTVLYGGYEFFTRNYSQETWTWNGARWTEIDGKHPGYRALAATFYDPNQKKVIVYGGIGRKSREGSLTRFADTWSFNGRDWVEVQNANSPPSRYNAFVGLDPTTGLTHLFGGKNEVEQFTNEHFVWNGTSWSQVTFANTPSPRQGGGLAWDPSTEALTLYGGFAGWTLAEVWRLGPEAWTPVEEDLVRRRATILPSASKGPTDVFSVSRRGSE